ncbi:hypothetical protein [Flavobacterium sp. NRK1]|uniref:hypothetical protein n=1 Tax=Flavobacterium sp. NRK1 TaxID=2954929 RepID=UPI002093CEA7|nr:hypothetical protein [Flavobacterium sp. NRK1]MCO6147526.1 hypothetical protein [Flavobacterium sp. NRK1]
MGEGTLLHIPNYEFENGERKNKFFLIIREIEHVQLIVSLPSSIEYLPSDIEIVHGCIELEKAQQTTYCFKAERVIASNTAFSFKKDTYLHGCWLHGIDKTAFFQKYSVENLHYEIKGVIDQHELNAIKKCFKNSCVVKNKYKRLL